MKTDYIWSSFTEWKEFFLYQMKVKKEKTANLTHVFNWKLSFFPSFFRSSDLTNWHNITERSKTIYPFHQEIVFYVTFKSSLIQKWQMDAI